MAILRFSPIIAGTFKASYNWTKSSGREISPSKQTFRHLKKKIQASQTEKISGSFFQTKKSDFRNKTKNTSCFLVYLIDFPRSCGTLKTFSSASNLMYISADCVDSADNAAIIETNFKQLAFFKNFIFSTILEKLS